MNEYLRYSKVVGAKYNLFECVRITNLKQVYFYLENGIQLLDVYSGKDKNNKPTLVFLFYKEDTKEIYEKWCKQNG